MIEKQFITRIFASNGTTFKKAFTSDEPSDSSLPHLKNIPNFRSVINGGQGESLLDLSYPFDDFSEGTVIDFMNVVTITAVVTDTDLKTQDEYQIYKGFISRYESYIEGDQEGVRVSCLGLVSLLSLSYYKDADFSVTHTGEDPEDIGRAVIDHYNSVYSSFQQLSYSNDTTDTVGQNVTVTFEDQKWFEALKKVGELSGSNWWWKVDESGLYWLKNRPSTISHRFTIGKDVISLNCPKDSEQVINDVEVRRTGGTATPYSDSTSITTFGKRTKIVSESSLGDEGTADQRGEKLVADNKDEKIVATLVINSNYPIETIKVGELCKVRNFKESNTFFGSNGLLIAAVDYLGDTVRLDLERSIGFGDELSKFVNES